MGRLHTKDVSEHLFKGPIIPFGSLHWLSITLFLRKTGQESLIWKESITWIVPWIRSVRGENFGRVTLMVADIEELETMERITNLLKKTQCEREVIFPKENGKFYFSNQQMDESNFLEEINT